MCVNSIYVGSDDLYDVLLERVSNMGDLSVFVNDTSTHIPVKRTHVGKVFHQPGDPLCILPYRGKGSIALHRVLRKHYPRLDVVFCHDQYYGVKYLYRRGLERRNVKLRVKLLLKKGKRKRF